MLLEALLGKPCSQRHPEVASGVQKQKRPAIGEPLIRKLAGCTGLEPATSDVTGRRSNQLS